jgi:hypothetical protein
MALQGVEPLRPEAAVGSEPRVDLGEGSGVELVPPLLRLLADAHEAGVAQHAQVLGHPGLADPEGVHQLAHGSVAIAEQVEDPAASWLGDDVERDRHAGMIAK